MKSRIFFLLPLCAIALAAGYFLWPSLSCTITASTDSGYSELSSQAAPANMCALFYNPKTGVFNAAEFLNFRAELSAKEKVTDEDISASLNNPEHFLAVIEALSAQDKYEGLSFSEKIKDLSVKELKKLHDTIKDYTTKSLLEKGISGVLGKSKTKNSLSVLELPRLLVDVYRIIYRPKGFWRNLAETKKISEAFDKLDDARIQERLQLSLFTDTMEQTFDVIVRDPNLKSRFGNSLRNNSTAVDTSMFVALWGANIGSKLFMDMQIDPMSASGFIQFMPLILPGTGRQPKIVISKQNLETARTKGLAAAMQEIKDDIKSHMVKSHAIGVGRWTYAAIFGSLFISTVSPDVTRLYDEYQQRQNPQAAVVTTPVKPRQQEEPVYSSDVDLRAIADFNQYVRMLKEQGVEVDINSKEMQDNKRERIEMYRRISNSLRQTP